MPTESPKYRIKGWLKHFENNRTKELKKMAWVPMPIQHDGDGYTELVGRPGGAACFGVWCFLVQLAAACEERGTLVRGNSKPHDIKSFARISRMSEKSFEEAIPVLLEVGWLEEVTEIPQMPAALMEVVPQSAPPEDAALRERAGACGRDTRPYQTIPPNHRPQDITPDQTTAPQTGPENGRGLGKGFGGNGVEVGNGSGMGLGAALRETLLAVKPRPPDTGDFDFDDKSDAKKMLLDFGVKEAKASDLIKSSYVTAKRVRDEIRKVNRDPKAENKPGVLIYRLEERRSG